LQRRFAIVLSLHDSMRRYVKDRAFADAGVTPKIVRRTPCRLTVAALARKGTEISTVTPSAVEVIDCSKLVVRPFKPVVGFWALFLSAPRVPTPAFINASVKLPYEETAAGVTYRRLGGLGYYCVPALDQLDFGVKAVWLSVG
jgi:hypothetical protein